VNGGDRLSSDRAIVRFWIFLSWCRWIACLFILCFLLNPVSDLAARTSPPRGGPPFDAGGFPYPSSQTIEKELKSYLGVRYRLGGADKKGLDCSGFTKRVYLNLFGIDLPHNASEQSKAEILDEVPRSKLDTGDLLFFRRNRQSKRINHVGVYLEEGRFIHASQKRGVIIISSLNNPHWQSRLYGAKRPPPLESNMDRGEEPWSQIALKAFLSEKDEMGLSYSHSPMGLQPLERASFAATLWDDQVFSPLRLELETRQMLELAYTRSLMTDAWNLQLSGFRRNYALLDKKSDLPGLFAGPPRDESDEPMDRMGLRVGTSIRPFEWLNITPSLAWLEKGEWVESLPERALALQVDLASLDLGWSFSTRLTYFDQGDLFSSLLEFDSKNRSYVDVSFTLQHRLSGTSHISFTGRQLTRVGFGDSSRTDNESEQFFSLSLGFHY
jgi:hypothetical protein